MTAVAGGSPEVVTKAADRASRRPRSASGGARMDEASRSWAGEEARVCVAAGPGRAATRTASRAIVPPRRLREDRFILVFYLIEGRPSSILCWIRSEEGHLKIGEAGERLAAAHLRRKGHRIIAANYRCRIGEIDIVSECDGIIVFCEVKTRRSDSRGAPFESVTIRKQAKLRRLAEYFLLREFGRMKTCRFDVVSLWIDDAGRPDILHIENAFS